ncbi:MAG: DUF1295 domain-containing protein [Proteobacteria bacterium]|nr:DUF1295 domain-containing protein [Pseudomonadota bacterium]
MTEPILCAFSGLAASVFLALLAWLSSLHLHDASIVDPFWPCMIFAAGLAYAGCLPPSGERGILTLLLALAWALRLGGHLAWRRRAHPGEDRRYQAIRARHEPGFGFKSLYLVFGLQAVLAWCVSMPLGVAWAAHRPWHLPDLVGASLAAFGLIFEAVADAQLAAFRCNPAAAGQVMDRGLWRYSRHPNYFGEACFWWGLGMLAVSGSGWAGAWSLLSPLLMTVLLLKVSGVGLLEADLLERRGQAYRDYVARTPAFFPGRPHEGTAP